jgi:hypothetical protein
MQTILSDRTTQEETVKQNKEPMTYGLCAYLYHRPIVKVLQKLVQLWTRLPWRRNISQRQLSMLSLAPLFPRSGTSILRQILVPTAAASNNSYHVLPKHF